MELSNIRISNLGLQPWRMNILTYDPITMTVFFATENQIKLTKLKNWGFYNEIILTLDLNDSSDEINQIQFRHPNLVAVTKLALIYIYNIENLNLQPIVLNASYKDIEDCSVWSLDMTSKLLAVGSNSKIISIWNLTQLNPLLLNINHNTTQPQDNTMRTGQNYKVLSDTQYTTFPTRFVQSITGNTHNIPCVKFSPCEKYIGTVSIDKVVRIFCVATSKLITQVQMNGWVWAIVWIGEAQSSLDNYQLVISLAKELFLMKVIKKNQSYCIEKIASQINNSHSSIGNHCRYSIVRYLADKNMVLASIQSFFYDYEVGQHTPDVHFFKLFKDKNQELNWESQRIINLPAETYIIGAHFGKLSKSASYVILASLQGTVYIYEIEDEQGQEDLLNEIVI